MDDSRRVLAVRFRQSSATARAAHSARDCFDKPGPAPIRACPQPQSRTIGRRPRSQLRRLQRARNEPAAADCPATYSPLPLPRFMTPRETHTNIKGLHPARHEPLTVEQPTLGSAIRWRNPLAGDNRQIPGHWRKLATGRCSQCDVRKRTLARPQSPAEAAPRHRIGAGRPVAPQ